MALDAHSKSTLADLAKSLASLAKGGQPHSLRSLPLTDDPLINQLIDSFNSAIAFLAAQAAQAAQEQNLVLSKYRFLDTVLSSLPGLVSYVDRDLRYQYVNDAYQKWFGLSREQCLKSTMYDVIGDAGVCAVKEQLEDAFNGEMQEFERKISYKNGAPKHIQVQYVPDKGPDGAIRGIIVIVNDVTKEKKAIEEKENALLHSIEDSSRIHALFTQSADPIMTLAPPTWKFTGCNPAALKLFEVASVKDFKNLGPWDVSPKEQPDGSLSSNKAPEVILQAMKTGSHFFEWNHKTTSGKIINCTVLLSRIDAKSEQYLQATVRDVSKEREALDSLRIKTEELNSIYLNSPLGILELDEKCRIKRCNPAYQAMLEYQEHELLGRSIMDITHEEDKDESQKKAQSIAAQGGQFNSFEKRYISKTGKIVWTAVTSRALKDESGVRYLSIVEDVTEKKSRAIETSIILETMAEGLVIQNKDGAIEIHNPAAQKLLGLSTEQLLGKTSMDPSWKAITEAGLPFPGDQHPAIEALRTGNPILGVKMGLTLPDGRQSWIKINAIPFESSDGRKVACTFSDITELLNAQSEIRFVLDALRIGVWKFNPVTQDLYWDKSMYEVFEINAADFNGHYQAWESTLTPESKKIAVDELSKALKGEKEFNTEFEITTKSRGKRFISGQGAVTRDQAGKPIMMYGINADVTEQVQLRKELDLERAKTIRSAKLASLGEMSAGIAHEINNPLAIISASVGLLSKFSQDPAKFGAKIETIKKACDRIARIVGGLRKFSRSGDKATFKTYDLSKIAADALILTEAKSKRHFTPVAFEFEGSSPVLCDEVEIEQVLVNLINNAIDAVKDRPEKWVRVSLFNDNHAVVLRVEDSGPGIPENVRNRIFDPFFTTKKVGEGTGLGLSISKGILDEHKATITVVTDAPNTCFEIRFSRAETGNDAT